ncbi:MAG TPA: hypothetical protein VKA91_02020 [Nitrososphaeraceae archaeon]|nr:hypothetical protein [Nitrososphaeraceae archaeon]
MSLALAAILSIVASGFTQPQQVLADDGDRFKGRQLKVEVENRDYKLGPADFLLDCGEDCDLAINLNDKNKEIKAEAGDTINLKNSIGSDLDSLRVLLQADSNEANVVGEENGDGGVIFEFDGDLNTIHSESNPPNFKGETSFEIPDDIDADTYNIIFDYNIGEEFDIYFVTPIKIR